MTCNLALERQLLEGKLRCTFRQVVLVSQISVAISLSICFGAIAQDNFEQPDPARFSTGADVFRAAAGSNLGGPTSAGSQLVENRALRQFDSRNPWLDAAFQPIEDRLEQLRLETC